MVYGLIINTHFGVRRKSSNASTTCDIFVVNILKLLCIPVFGFNLYLYILRIPKLFIRIIFNSLQFAIKRFVTRG